MIDDQHLTGKELLLRDLEYYSSMEEYAELKQEIIDGRYSEHGSTSITPGEDLVKVLQKLNFEDMYEKALCGLYYHDF